jgi:hypothetical protein
MKHELFFDEKHSLMVMRIKGNFTADDARASAEFIDKTTKENGTCDALVDLREASPRLDKDVRRMLREQSERTEVRKFAMVVTHPALRVIGKIATSSIKNSGIFKNEEEALKWLKED